MEFKRYFVIQELLELSRKSDAYIEKVFSEPFIDENFFVDTRKRLCEILNSGDSKENALPKTQRAKNKLITKWKPPLEQHLECRSRVHDRSQSIKIPDDVSCKTETLSPNSKEREDGYSGTVLISFSDTEEKPEEHIHKIDTGKLIPNEEVSEIDRLLALDFGECKASMSGEGHTSNTICSKTSTFNVKSSDNSNLDGEECIPVTPNLKIHNFVTGLTYFKKQNKLVESTPKNFKELPELDGVERSKRRTRSFQKYCSSMGIPLDGSFNAFPKTSGNIESIANQTYIVSSGLKDNTVDENTVEYSRISENGKILINTNYAVEILGNVGSIANKTFVISSDSSYENADSETSEKMKLGVNNAVLPSPRCYIKKIKNNCGRKRKRSSDELHGNNLSEKEKSPFNKDISLPPNKRKKSNRSESSNLINTSDEKISNMLTSSPFKSLEHRLNNANCSDDKFKTTKVLHDKMVAPFHGVSHTTNIPRDVVSKSVNSPNDSKLSNNSASDSTDSYGKMVRKSINSPNDFELSENSKTKCSISIKCFEGTENEAVMYKKDSRVRRNKCSIKQKQLPARKYEEFPDSVETHVTKKASKQAQSKPASEYNRKTAEETSRPDTPLEFISNCNRKSLKEKQDEKRKQREFRELKIRERKERLEKEREERIRLTEDKLKKRLQQHEDMLKQKMVKFKTKRQRLNTKRSLSSISSKDSDEGRTKNGSDFCRNTEDSGQKLSKESSGYNDVPLKNVAPTSLEGKIGLNPEVSENRKAILVHCGMTPVEFFLSSDVIEAEKEMIPVSQDVTRIKSVEESRSIVQHGSFRQQSPYDKFTMNSSPRINEAPVPLKSGDSSKSLNKKSKRDKEDSAKRGSKMTQLKTIDHIKALSKQIFSKNISKEKKSSYFLRSAKKACPTKPLKELVHRTNDTQEDFSETTLTSNREKSEPGFLCRKKSKMMKSKTHFKAPSCNKTPADCKRSVKFNQAKRCHTDPANLTKTSKRSQKETQELKSYKISGMHENSFDESKVDSKKIPLWAAGVHLKQALIQQHYNPLDPEKIFGVPSKEPIDLVVIFNIDKAEYHRRTSSEKWSSNTTPT